MTSQTVTSHIAPFISRPPMSCAALREHAVIPCQIIQLLYVLYIQVGGNSGNVLGVCRLLSSVAGGPMFWISGAISRKIGVNGVLTWSFTSYVLRFMIYASIKNPWQVRYVT